MSSSSDLLESMSLFEIPADIIQLGLDLVAFGKSDRTQYYATHPTLPNASMVYVQVTPPKEGAKGKVKLYEVSERDFPIVNLTGDVKNYPMKMYQGHRVYIHPHHSQIAKATREGTYGGGDLEVGLLLIKGRGLVTFVAS